MWCEPRKIGPQQHTGAHSERSGARFGRALDDDQRQEGLYVTEAARRKRIGILYPYRDPISPQSWSGTPRGLATGFEANGLEVVPIGGAVPTVFRYGVAALYRVDRRIATIAQRLPAMAAMRTRAVRKQLAVAPALDALLAMDTEAFDLAAIMPSSIPVVTYDDGTFALFSRHTDSDIARSGISKAIVAKWIERQRSACQAATRCLLSTSWAAQSVIEDYGVPAERVTVVGMGHRPRAVSTDRRDWSSPRFLFVGVDWRRKNGAAVLAAFDQVRRRYPNARLDVVGHHAPISQDGVTDHGMLPRDDPDAQRTLDDLFATCTAFVLPSRFDPAGIVYLEAASAGLPVVATTEGGAGEMLEDGAISVHPDDDAALIRAMLKLADSDTAKKLGAEAARRAKHASWVDVTRRILAAVRLERIE
jgi:glycosyltransferase involved in cell wall biosynthesis